MHTWQECKPTIGSLAPPHPHEICFISAVEEVMDGLTEIERFAFHLVCCLNSPEAAFQATVVGIADKVSRAVHRDTCE